ncbi:MAG: winged helix-turn-helix transcriptional regulator [Rhodobacteraceae bacterium]|nr:winged helix-turn-helix transcriptional regulator [Paracoccaceae bacterium]
MIQRSLIKQRCELKLHGIAHRKVYAVVSPRVEYSLNGWEPKVGTSNPRLGHLGSILPGGTRVTRWCVVGAYD